MKAAIDEAAKIAGVKKVITIEDPSFAHLLPETVSPVLEKIAKDYSHVIAGSSNVTKNILPRTAALLDSAVVGEVVSILSEDSFQRPVYAGNAMATIQSRDKIKFLLIRGTAFEKAVFGETKAAIEAGNVSVTTSDLSRFVSASVSKSDRPDLAAARVVVSGGRGLKNGENFKLLEQLADKLIGAVGASRAAVDAGFVSNDLQVGQTGKVVAPDLYIAVGISGAIQHLSGMKDSKVIAAINKDKEAPIFQVADFGLVDDLFKAVPEMTSKL
jgi:electron transfer flavoprotein alpha subunit